MSFLTLLATDLFFRSGSGQNSARMRGQSACGTIPIRGRTPRHLVSTRFRCGGKAEGAFGFEAELAAGGVDVVAFFAPEGGGDVAGFEGFEKLFLDGFDGALPRQAFDFVVGDEVYFGVELQG